MSEEQQQTNVELDISDTFNAHMEMLSPKQRKFLKAYGECGVVKYACKAAGIHRSTFYDWRNRDENFKACLPDFEDDANDTLEYAAYVQSVVGAEEPALSMGRLVYQEEPMLNNDGTPQLDGRGRPMMKRGKQVMIKKYSPQLLITLLKARLPEKYKERSQVDANVNAQVDANILNIDTRKLTPEQLSQLKGIALAIKESESTP